MWWQVAEEDEEPQVVSPCLSSQPEEWEQETRSKWAVRSRDRDGPSALQELSNARNMDRSTIPLRSNLYTLNKISVL